MREWRLTVIVGLIIIFTTLAFSVAIVYVFNALIWSHLPKETHLIFDPLGIVFLAIISIVTNLLAIPASVVQVRQLFSDAEEKARIVRRQTFARERLRELQDIGLQEEWKDEHFAELEAEVEAEGRRRIFSSISFLSRLSSGKRLEKSLSEALTTSQERLILVEGEPGSGKSVALRHVAESITEHARRVKSTKSTIPILVNLKELERTEGMPINRKLIEQFILGVLKKKNDRDIEEFLEENFNQGMEEGSWLFLFDSFDELPEILSSTEADVIIKSYGNAINDFLSGINKCRGIVASRPFRGPAYLGWPRFQVLPLSDTRRMELIHRLGLKPQVERKLIQELGTASEEIRARAGNPLFLTLLGRHMKIGHPFPNSAHTVFETYISSRFGRDKDRLQKRFNLDIDQLRTAAESIAFCMNSDPRVGLSPTRENLRGAITRLSLKIDGNLDTLLDALEYMKIARSDASKDTSGSRSFTFAHRRFQEYFATCVVLRDPSLFKPNELLTNERWRETAVTMCQTQPIGVVKPIVKEASRLLRRYCANIPDMIDNPVEYIRGKEQNKPIKKKISVHTFSPRSIKDLLRGKKQNKPTREKMPVRIFFPWPKGSLHLLNLLQDSFSSHLKDLPDSITVPMSILVLSATERGTLSDRKWALEVSGIAPEDILEYLLENAFSSRSQWLKEVAYRQVARLNIIPPSILKGIREAIIYLACTGRLSRERYATEAHLARINQKSEILPILQLLLWLPRIDIVFHSSLFIITISTFFYLGLFNPLLALLFFGILCFSYSGLRSFIGPLHNFIWSPLVVAIPRFMLIISLPLIIFLLKIVIWYNIDSLTIVSIIIFTTIYISLFGPFAFMAAQSGKFIKVRWWILLPIWPILYIFTELSLLIGSFITLLVLAVLFEVEVRQSLSTASYVSYDPNANFITPPIWLQSLFNFLAIFGIIGAVLGCLIGISGFIWWIYSWGSDWLQWYSWNRNHHKQITCEEFCKAANTYHHKLFCAWVVRIVRVQHLLEMKNETENMLRKFAVAIERRQLFDRKERNLFRKLLKALEKGQQLNQDEENLAVALDLLGCPKEYFKLVQRSNPEFTDELCRLLEDIQTFKKYVSFR